MNKDNAALYLPLVKALAEGKTIEFQASPGRWMTIAKPDFSCTPEYYRIKREPKVRWAIYDGGGFCRKLRFAGRCTQQQYSCK